MTFKAEQVSVYVHKSKMCFKRFLGMVLQIMQKPLIQKIPHVPKNSG
jgi:hypothetical protein